jgi:hypothetical protein
MTMVVPSLQRRWTPSLTTVLPVLSKEDHNKRQESWYSRHGNKRRRLSIYMATAIAVLVSTIVWLEHTNATLRTLTSSHQNNGTLLDAIVTVAMCGFNANEMVKALRAKGEWKGPIYVITDDPSQEDATLCTPVDVRGNHPTFLTQPEFESYKLGIQEFNPDIWSKWHKTQLFQLLPDPNIQTILFIDADVLAQKPLAKSFLPSLAPMLADRTCELSSYPERWYTKIPVLGKVDRKNAGKICGFMSIQKRTETAPFLNEWSNRLVRPPFMARDQGKLTLSVESLNTKICELPNRWSHVQNQADLMDRIWFSMVGKGTFLHLASSKDWSTNEGASWKEMAAKKCDLSNLPDKVPKPTLSARNEQ